MVDDLVWYSPQIFVGILILLSAFGILELVYRKRNKSHDAARIPRATAPSTLDGSRRFSRNRNFAGPRMGFAGTNLGSAFSSVSFDELAEGQEDDE